MNHIVVLLEVVIAVVFILAVMSFGLWAIVRLAGNAMGSQRPN